MADLRQRQTVLIADDVPENIELLAAILDESYDIKVASNGERVIKIVYSEDPPDLILLDVMMPGLSGHEVCRRLKANPDRCKIPVIFVTAMSTVEDEQLGLEIGAVDYITKPFSLPVVKARYAHIWHSTIKPVSWNEWWISAPGICWFHASKSFVDSGGPPSSRTTKRATM